VIPKRLGEVLRNSLAFVGTYGVGRFVQELHYRFVNQYYERRLGVETSGMVELSDLGIQNSEFSEYTPIGYSAIYSALNRIPLPVSSVSFLDYGSGKGRGIIAAATFPFRKVLGVEISEELNNVAKANIEAMRHRKAEVIEVVQCNAEKFAVPDDVNLIHFFNPFSGAPLEKVVRNILVSHRAKPRTIYIIYFNKMHFERLVKHAGYHWIKPIYATHVYPSYSCGIYEIAQTGVAGRDRKHA
jgi:predicted RNA methylase